MPLPKQAMDENTQWADIYTFQDSLRVFVEDCYPNDALKGAAAWEYVKKAKSIETIQQQTNASRIDAIARYNGIYTLLDTMKVPNARELALYFGLPRGFA
jgi:hypothetical protein